MTRTELLHAALKKLAEAVKLRDNAGEELLADDALELAERVNLSICNVGRVHQAVLSRVSSLLEWARRQLLSWLGYEVVA